MSASAGSQRRRPPPAGRPCLSQRQTERGLTPSAAAATPTRAEIGSLSSRAATSALSAASRRSAEEPASAAGAAATVGGSPSLAKL